MKVKFYEKGEEFFVAEMTHIPRRGDKIDNEVLDWSYTVQHVHFVFDHDGDHVLLEVE